MACLGSACPFLVVLHTRLLAFLPLVCHMRYAMAGASCAGRRFAVLPLERLVSRLFEALLRLCEALRS